MVVASWRRGWRRLFTTGCGSVEGLVSRLIITVIEKLGIIE